MRDFDVWATLTNHYVRMNMCGDFDLYSRAVFPARERMWYKTNTKVDKWTLQGRGCNTSKEFTSKWKSR